MEETHPDSFLVPSPREKQQIRVEFFFSRLLAIPNWQLKPPRHLAASTRTNVTRLLQLIHQAPDVRSIWREAKARRHAIARIQKKRKFDFRKIDGWLDLCPEEIASRLGLSLGYLRDGISKSPVLRRAWSQRPSLGRNVDTSLIRGRYEKIKAIPGWETMSLSDIAKAIGVSRQRIYQIIGKDEAVAELLKSRKGRPSRWNQEAILAIHARCPSSQEAAKAMGVGVSTYYKNLRKIGVPPQPHWRTLQRPTFAQRLEKVPGWQKMSYTDIARAFGVCKARVRELFARHPELHAQKTVHIPPPKSPGRLGLAEQIKRLPNWEKTSTQEIARLTGISVAWVLAVFHCNPDMPRSRRNRAPWINPTQDIRRIHGWERQNAVCLAGQLKQLPEDVSVAIRENREMRKLWRPQYKAAPLLAAILKVPGWKKMSHTELGHVLGKRPINVHRALMVHCYHSESGIDPSTVKALTSVGDSLGNHRILKDPDEIRVESGHSLRR